MIFKTIRVFNWPGNSQGPVRLLLKAGVGMSLVLATVYPIHRAQDEKDFQVSCQHVEPVAKEKVCTELRTCSACKQTFPILQFPPKGGGRREGRCCGCHNVWRRNKYKAISKTGPYADGELIVTQFDEGNEGLNTILDIICDEIIRKEIAI